MDPSGDRIPPPFSPPDCPWVSMVPGKATPKNAVEGGGKLKGSPTFIGRVFDDDCYLVGTALPDKEACIYLSKKGEIKSTSYYDILTVDCANPLEFQPMAIESHLMFVSGGDLDHCIYCSRVVDKENTYIGWADADTKTVYVPREPEAGPNKLTEGYEILIHTLLDRLCVCPMPPNPPPF